MSRKVLIFGMNYAPELAGVGRYTGEIAEFLQRRGSEVVVVTTPAHYPGWTVQKPFKRWSYSVERRNGVKVIRCPLLLRRDIGGIWRLIAPLTFAIAAAPVLLWQFLAYRPQIAISVVPTLFGAPLVLLGAAFAGSKTVLHMQDLEVDAAFAVGHLGDYKWLRSLATAFERWIIGSFSQVITISDRMAGKIEQKGVQRSKIAVIRNWVDLDLIKPLERESSYRSELQIRSNDFTVLYSGNLGRKQGLGVLLRAVEHLVDQRNIRFIIAGEGPDKARIESQSGSLPNLHVLPFQPAERMSEFLGLANLHVLPQEASMADLVLPSKLGGMLASGKPIVIMTDPGTEMMSFVEDSVTVVEPGNAQALANAIFLASHEREADTSKALVRRRLAKSLSKVEGLANFAQVVVR